MSERLCNKCQKPIAQPVFDGRCEDCYADDLAQGCIYSRQPCLAERRKMGRRDLSSKYGSGYRDVGRVVRKMG